MGKAKIKISRKILANMAMGDLFDVIGVDIPDIPEVVTLIIESSRFDWQGDEPKPIELHVHRQTDNYGHVKFDWHFREEE